MQYRTWRIHLKDLTESEKTELLKLSLMCRDYYNAAMRQIAEGQRKNGKIPTFLELLSRLSNSPCYLDMKYNLLLQRARNASLQGRTRLKENKPLTIQCYATQRDNRIVFPATRKTRELSFPVPAELAGKSIVITHLKLLPGTSDYWELQVICSEKENKQNGLCNFAAIDLGIENFATIAANNGATLIIDGRRLKSILWHGHKQRKRDREKARRKLYNQTSDYIQKAAAIVCDFCLENSVGTVVVGTGVLRDSMRRLRIASLWPDFPFSRFVGKLKSALEKHGIKLTLHEELFTSQASFIDGDELPTQLIGHKPFSGKRVKRGLYRSRDGILINADVNGALNLLAKSTVAPVRHLRQNPKSIQQPRRIDPLKQ